MNIDALVPHELLKAQTSTILVDDPLMDLQIKFNLFPALYLHSSWVEYLHLDIEPSSLLAKLDEQSFVIRNLSADILRAFKLDQTFDFEFGDHLKRIVFIDTPILKDITNRVLALLLRDRIAKVIYGREVKSLHRGIGADVHRWVLSYHEQLPKLSSPCFVFEKRWPSSKTWRSLVEQMILSFVPKEADAVFFRLKLKLSYESRQLERLDVLDADRIVIGELFVRLIEQYHPQWLWLFKHKTIST